MHIFLRRKIFAPILSPLGRFWTMLFLSAAGILSGGCNDVSVTKPVGDMPVKLDAKDWQGVWILEPNEGDTAPLMVRVADATQGELEISIVDKADNGNLTLKTYHAQVRQHDDWQFVSLLDEDAKDAQGAKVVRYSWMRVKLSGDLALLWVPDATKFAKLVQDGKLPGAMDDKNVRLGELTPNQLQAFHDETWGVLFAWDQPLVFKRVQPLK